MDAIISLISERNVVFHVVELPRRLLRRRRLRLGGAGLRRRRRARLALAARLAAALAPAEHLHHVGADFRRVAVLAVLVLPLARAQAPFHVHLRALLEVLSVDGGEAPEEGDAMPLGRLLHLA